ncbi:unnamed protein product [Pedinophyceae sp. YPF-701]|nr:unnamed protein product [Pedinophyceae sp. YPF-701]
MPAEVHIGAAAAPRAASGALPAPRAKHVPPSPPPAAPHSRRSAALAMLASAACAAASSVASPAHALSCSGLNGRELQLCLRQQREARGLPKADEEERYEEYDQPGEKVTLPSGVQYRELQEGTGARTAEIGSVCEIAYTVYRLSSGAYYKYSSGGLPVMLFSFGTGKEIGDSVGDVYRFTLGEKNAVPAAVAAAMQGMREGAVRRILVPAGPAGWDADGKVQPQPRDFGGKRRLAAHRTEALLFEAELVRVLQPTEAGAAATDVAAPDIQQKPYSLPAPPSPFKKRLLPAEPAS